MCCKDLQTVLGAPAQCFDNKLACEENGRKFRIQLPRNSSETFCRVKIDGCLVSGHSDIKRCDYVFHRCHDGAYYFVELKGKDVAKACEQIMSAIDFLRPKLKFSPEKISAFVVASRSPLSSASVQVLRNEFRKKNYGHILEVRSREWTHKIGHLNV